MRARETGVAGGIGDVNLSATGRRRLGEVIDSQGGKSDKLLPTGALEASSLGEQRQELQAGPVGRMRLAWFSHWTCYLTGGQ